MAEKNKGIKALKEYRRKVEAGEIEPTKPETNLIIKAKQNPKSKQKAIAAFCFHCMGGSEGGPPDPGWRTLIATCTSPSCPLYPHRPFK